MENQIKFTEEELQNIKSIQDDNTQLIMESGQLELELYSMNTRLKALDNEKSSMQDRYMVLRDREQKLVQELNTKYGSGTVDIESGVFIPTK
jgi:predicted nuclease with TOPRIM domain